MTTGIQAHQSNLIQQMSKYQNSIADYNLNKLIRQCRNAINSAQTSQEAQSIASYLESALSAQGKGLSDVQGLNFNKLNAAGTAFQQNNVVTGAGSAGGIKGNEARNGGVAALSGVTDEAARKQIKRERKNQYKSLFNDLKAEFGVGGTKDKYWIDAAKNNDNMKILDKNGQDVSKTFNGDKLKGYTVVINSKKHGQVRIQAGGDGYLNGGDDKVTMVGGPAATASMTNGLNQLNNKPQGLLPNGKTNQNNPFFNAAADTNDAMAIGLYTETQIKNLIAAIMNQALFSLDQNQLQNQY